MNKFQTSNFRHKWVNYIKKYILHIFMIYNKLDVSRNISCLKAAMAGKLSF